MIATYPFSVCSKCALSVNLIAIELNVPCDDLSSAIELTCVTLGHGFKKAGSVLIDICAPGTSLDIWLTEWCYGCV